MSEFGNLGSLAVFSSLPDRAQRFAHDAMWCPCSEGSVELSAMLTRWLQTR